MWDWPSAEKLAASTPSPVGRTPEGCALRTLSPLHPTLLRLLLAPSAGTSEEAKEARLVQPTRVRSGQDGGGGASAQPWGVQPHSVHASLGR